MSAQDEQQARLAFQRARRKAFWREIWAQLRGQPNKLLSFEEVSAKLHIGGLVYRGIQAVPINKIIGSVDRYRDFDRAFLPSQDFTADRWRSIGRAFYNSVSLPPVKLYQVGDAYFVYDGNHRVSVAREMGAEFIDAQITECQTRVPISADLRAEDLDIKGEQAEFLERTRLDQLRPDYDIQFTIAGGYWRLLEHIAVHRHFKGLEWQREVPEDEAVMDWYDYIYTPIVEAVYQHNILDEFPERTVSDLYLWLIDHQHYLREQFGPQITADDAASDFGERHTPRPIVKRVLDAAQNLVEDLVHGGNKDDETEPSDADPSD